MSNGNNKKKKIDPTALGQKQKSEEGKVAFAFVVLETADGKIGMSEARSPEGDSFKIDTDEARLRVKRDCQAVIEMIDRQILRSIAKQELMKVLMSQMQKFQASSLVNQDGKPIIKRT